MGLPAKCDECPLAAVVEVHDHKETAPGKWERDTVRHFCANHARSQRLTFHGGRAFHGHEEVKE